MWRVRSPLATLTGRTQGVKSAVNMQGQLPGQGTTTTCPPDVSESRIPPKLPKADENGYLRCSLSPVASPWEPGTEQLIFNLDLRSTPRTHIVEEEN